MHKLTKWLTLPLALLCVGAFAGPESRVRTIPVFILDDHRQAGFVWVSTTDTRQIQLCFAAGYPIIGKVMCFEFTGKHYEGTEVRHLVPIEVEVIPDPRETTS